MLLFLKRLVLVVAAALLMQTTFGFALLGPRDTWQVSAIGYDPQGDFGDIGGPKNLGEEWRWVLPEIRYAFDQSFIDFFGTNGVAAVEEAIALFNKEMRGFSTMTDAQLRAKPLDTRRRHLTAEALGVLDLKTVTMGLLAEQLGLAAASRWTWAIRDTQIFTGNVTNYAIIQRNFDPFTLKPSRYVNGHKWTYFIGRFPTGVGGGTFEDAAEIAIDQARDTAFYGSAVSSMVGEDLLSPQIQAGEYFSGLTQDDIGGLRYIYRANNVNLENLPLATRDVAGLPPAIRVVDTNALTFVAGIDAFSFFTNSILSNPSALVSNLLARGLSTNISILSTNVTITNVVSTTFVLTNLVSSGLFTNTSLPTVITNLDLFAFSEDSRTNNAQILRALYPGLIITSTNSSFVTEVQEIYSLTNSPYGTPFDPLILVTNRVTNLVVNYRYRYANVITNYASATTDLEIQDIHPASFGTPVDFAFETNVMTIRTNIPSGGFYILDRSTNADLIAYSFYDENNVPLKRVTNIIDVFNFGFIITNIFNPFDIRIRQDITKFTNVVYAAYPVLLNGAAGQQIVSVTTTNQVARFDYTFDTNGFLIFPPSNGNTNVILQTITFTNGGPLRITQSNVFTELPKGTILILDTNNFVLAGPRIETFGLVTNVVNLFTNAATGEFITQLLIYQTNQIQFAVYPVTYVTPQGPSLRPGVDTIQFVRQPYLDYFDQINSITTNYYTITAITNGVAYRQTVRRVTSADIIFSTFDLTSSGAFPVAFSRTLNWLAPSPTGGTVVPAGATFNRGPGEIIGGSIIAFSTLSPSWVLQTPGPTREENSFLFLQWGSFDSKTLVPRLYPEDITGQLKTLEDIALRRNPAP